MTTQDVLVIVALLLSLITTLNLSIFYIQSLRQLMHKRNELKTAIKQAQQEADDYGRRFGPS